MSSVVLEQYVRAQIAVKFAQDVRDRMREQAGQTTVEWLVIMVGLVALAGVLAGRASGPTSPTPSATPSPP